MTYTNNKQKKKNVEKNEIGRLVRRIDLSCQNKIDQNRRDTTIACIKCNCRKTSNRAPDCICRENSDSTIPRLSNEGNDCKRAL